MVENLASSRSSSPAFEDDDEESLADDNMEDGNSESGSEDHLRGFSTDEDSSDDEVEGDMDGVDISTLPTIAKDDATVARKLAKARREQVSSVSSFVSMPAYVCPFARPKNGV